MAAAKFEFTTTLKLARETKNTYRFENDAEDAPITPLYVKKEVFGDVVPATIEVTVKVTK